MFAPFDIGKLPDRRFGIRHLLTVQPYTNFGAEIERVKRQMAMQLATAILESRDFFFERGDTMAGISMLEYGVNCIVLTDAEFAEAQRNAFKQGVLHGRGYVSPDGVSK